MQSELVPDLEEFDFTLLGDMLESPEECCEVQELPPVSDEDGWRERTRALAKFLAGGARRWPDLERWAALHDVRFDDLRNQIVVLEQSSEAESVGEGQQLAWRRPRKAARAA